MTTFWRDGFWRTSAYGNTHWVEGHWVERYDWDRGGYAPDHWNYVGHRLAELRADRGTTARFINPNANCPVCGEPVFFYQNEHGSRVYFDELGPPWPKHPCTVGFSSNEPASERSPTITPSFRPRDQNVYINSLLSAIQKEPDVEFWERYGTSPWNAWRVDGRFTSRLGRLLALSQLNSEVRRRTFLAARKFPRSLTIGKLVFLYKSWISYFDEETMQPIDIEVEQLPSSKVFIDRLLEKEGDA